MAEQIAIVLFDGVTALDAVGPYEVLTRVPEAEVSFVATEPGPKRTGDGRLALIADRTLAEMPAPDVVLVPGGPGTRSLLDDAELLGWLRVAHASSRWTTAVCTGSLILAAAGLLEARRATTHWRSLDQLRSLGAESVSERVVRSGKVITSAGVSAGIDMALILARELASDDVAQAIQLLIEYDPEPPFNAGSPKKASPAVVAAAEALARQRTTPSTAERAR